MLTLISKIKYCFKLKDLYLIKDIIKKNVNWLSFFLDFFSLSRSNLIIFQMRDGLKYLVRARTWDRGIITRVHLADEYDLNQLSLNSDSTIIDIGAHIGIFSIYISKKTERIFAYEPISENFKMLIKNIKLNNLEKKIHAYNFAVSDTNNNVKIYCSKFNTAGHSIYGYSNKFETASSVTLKDIFDNNKITKCDLLKIDTEGFEYRILSVLPKDYFKIIKRIYLENHVSISRISEHSLCLLRKILAENYFKVREKDNMLFAEK